MLHLEKTHYTVCIDFHINLKIISCKTLCKLDDSNTVMSQADTIIAAQNLPFHQMTVLDLNSMTD